MLVLLSTIEEFSHLAAELPREFRAVARMSPPRKSCRCYLFGDLCSPCQTEMDEYSSVQNGMLSQAEAKRLRVLELFENLKTNLTENIQGIDLSIWEFIQFVTNRNWDSVEECLPTVMACLAKSVAASEFSDRLGRIEASVDALAARQTIHDWYDTDQVAKILGKDPFTVREWCRLGRVHGEKRRSGRGKHKSWAISHDELLRIQKDGLLPQTDLPFSASRISRKRG